MKPHYGREEREGHTTAALRRKYIFRTYFPEKQERACCYGRRIVEGDWFEGTAGFRRDDEVEVDGSKSSQAEEAGEKTGREGTRRA